MNVIKELLLVFIIGVLANAINSSFTRFRSGGLLLGVWSVLIALIYRYFIVAYSYAIFNWISLQFSKLTYYF